MEDSHLINWKALSEVVIRVILQEGSSSMAEVFGPTVRWEASEGTITWAMALQKVQSAKGNNHGVGCCQLPKCEWK